MTEQEKRDLLAKVLLEEDAIETELAAYEAEYSKSIRNWKAFISQLESMPGRVTFERLAETFEGIDKHRLRHVVESIEALKSRLAEVEREKAGLKGQRQA